MSAQSQSLTRIATDHYFWLDWLRFLAAFGVMVAHARASNWTMYGQLAEGEKTLATFMFFAITRLGHEAVICFFVLSGFLVDGKVLERCRLRTFDPLLYVIDRVTRIYLPLGPALVLSVAVALGSGVVFPLASVFTPLVGLNGVVGGQIATNVALWSLAYEIWFYIVAGSLATMVVAGNWLARLVAACGLLLGMMVLAQLDWSLVAVWFVGAIAYHCRKMAMSTLWPGLVLAMAGIGLFELSSRTDSIATVTWVPHMPDSVLTLAMGAGFALMVIGIIRQIPSGAAINRVESVGTRLAAFSYSLYLTHYPVLLCLDSIMANGFDTMNGKATAFFVARLLVCVAIAFGFYWLFESRTAWLRSKLKPTRVSA